MKKYIILFSLNVRILPVYLKYGSPKCFYCTSSRSKNPYEVLGLKSTCNTRDIKKAYIKLCKELHPDVKPGDASQHKKFIELNNAYNDLLDSKGEKKIFRRETSQKRDTFWRPPKYKAEVSENEWTSEKPWYEREEYQEYIRRRKESNTTSGFRIANMWIIAGCFVLMIVGSFLYFLAYSYATAYTKRTVDERSKKISESYHGLRNDALYKEKTENLDGLKKKWNE